MGRGSQNIRLYLKISSTLVGYLQLYYATFLFFNKYFIFKKLKY